MKKLRVVFAVAMFSLFSVAAQAQTENVGTLLSGLVNVVVQDIDITDFQVINIEDSEILTDFEINILRNAVNNNRIIRDIIIEDNQVVVGVNLLGEQVFVLDN